MHFLKDQYWCYCIIYP